MGSRLSGPRECCVISLNGFVQCETLEIDGKVFRRGEQLPVALFVQHQNTLRGIYGTRNTSLTSSKHEQLRSWTGIDLRFAD